MGKKKMEGKIDEANYKERGGWEPHADRQRVRLPVFWEFLILFK